MAKRDKKKYPLARVESRIFSIRGQKVILDSDLAAVYAVTPKRLNEQVKRNLDRFPEDFCFQLVDSEWQDLRSQNATLEKGSGKHRKYLPSVFTEHGALMAANVLKSKKAAQMSVFVVRAFVRLREMAITHRELSDKLKELEQRVGQHDADISAIVKAIRRLMTPPEEKKKEIGFRVKERRIQYGVR